MRASPLIAVAVRPRTTQHLGLSALFDEPFFAFDGAPCASVTCCASPSLPVVYHRRRIVCTTNAAVS
jgi:hypothetical protein